MMDWDSITRTGARSPGVERKTGRTGVLISTSLLTQSRENFMTAEGTKDDGKPVVWEGFV
jgi:hypothetical protein